MAFNVSQFRASLVNDGARASLFEVILPFPTGIFGGIGTGLTTATADLSFKCRAASLPGDSISSIEIPYFGRTIKVAGTRSFPTWSITVINDETFNVRNNLEIWMSAINSHVSNLRVPTFNPPLAYQSDATVIQYGKSGDPVKSYKMVGCFPIGIDPIDLDWASGDAVEEFGVQFEYQWWESPSTLSTGSNIPTTDFG